MELQPKSLDKVKLAPTSYERIMLMSNFFSARNDNSNIKFDKKIVLSRKRIEDLLKTNAPYLIAIIVLRGNRGNIEIVPSNSSGNDIDAGSISEDIKTSHKNLKKELKANDKKLFELPDFPFLIKMERCGIERIFNAMDSKSFLFYPCIEEGWRIDDPSSEELHFTIGVLASAKNNDEVNDSHKPSASGEDKIVVNGEETWPRRNFSWSSNVLVPGT